MEAGKSERARQYGKRLEAKGLADAYRASMEDLELLQLREEIALLDLRIAQLVETIEAETVYEDEVLDDIRSRFPNLSMQEQQALAEYVLAYLPANFVDYRTFGRLLSLVERYEEALLARRIIQADEALRLLFQSIRDGRRAGSIWEDIRDVMNDRRKLVETETKRMAMNEQLIPVDRVIVLLTETIESLKGAVQRYVPDKETQNFILAEAQRTYQRNIFGSPEGGDSNQRIVDLAR